MWSSLGPKAGNSLIATCAAYMESKNKNVLAEIEAKSWSEEAKEAHVLVAKKVIMRAMLEANSWKQAEAYLKKCIIKLGSKTKVIRRLLYFYSKVLPKFYDEDKVVLRLLELERLASLEAIDTGLFENLLRHLSIIGADSTKEAVYESWLRRADKQKDFRVWLQYAEEEVRQGQWAKAKAIIGRGLPLVADQSSLTTGFNAITSTYK